MIEGNIANRLASLQLGDASLVFGRIDTTQSAGGDSFHIGRLAVSDEHREPLVVDWRAPVAEPFYRATGRLPMGLVRRRHFATRGRQLLAIEDELFGESAGLFGWRAVDHRRRSRDPRSQHAHPRPRGGAHRPPHATSSPRSRASRTRSSAPSSPACSWCRADPAPARPWWRCTAPPTCSTRTGSRSRARGCSWWAPTGSSSATSSRCCPASARPAWSSPCSPTCSTARARSTSRAAISPNRPASRATSAWRRCSQAGRARPTATAPHARCVWATALQTLSLTRRPEQGHRG